MGTSAKDGGSNTSGKEALLAKQAEGRRAALSMRCDGASYAAIAKALGISDVQAQRRVKRELRRIPKDEADECRAIELARLDDLTGRAVAVMASCDPELQLKAIDRVLRISESRRRMLGLDAPTKVDAIGIMGAAFDSATTADEVAAIAESMAKSLRAGAAR